jgi:BlaI family transcriptional regulator, penicillinase repressor
LDILYRRGRATAAEILSECADTRSYSTVRTQLRVLEQKGCIKRHVRVGPHVYSPEVSKRLARGHAFRHFLDTFFGGSLEQAVVFALRSKSLRLTNDAKARLLTLCTTEASRGATPFE